MALNNLNKPIMWLIMIRSKRNLSNKDRDFITELVSEEARKTTKSYYFILHDIVESKRYSKMLIEGRKIAVKNLLLIIRSNLPYAIKYRRHMQ